MVFLPGQSLHMHSSMSFLRFYSFSPVGFAAYQYILLLGIDSDGPSFFTLVDNIVHNPQDSLFKSQRWLCWDFSRPNILSFFDKIWIFVAGYLAVADGPTSSWTQISKTRHWETCVLPCLPCLLPNTFTYVFKAYKCSFIYHKLRYFTGMFLWIAWLWRQWGRERGSEVSLTSAAALGWALSPPSVTTLLAWTQTAPRSTSRPTCPGVDAFWSWPMLGLTSGSLKIDLFEICPALWEHHLLLY